MSLPCFCFKCARYFNLQTLNNEWCLAMEKKNCGERFCHDCDLICEQFVKRKPEYDKEEIFFPQEDCFLKGAIR